MLAMPNAIAIGTGAIATGSVAVGAAASSANGGAAFGDGASASGSLSAALGPNAVASAPNSVALGAGSIANAANTVSVGAPSSERRITNVAPGIAPSDAATVGQLTSLGAGFQSQVTSLQSQVNTLSAAIAGVQTEERRGIAAAAAMGITMTPSAPGKTTVMVNTGFFQGETAVGIAVAHRLTFTTPVIVHGGYANAGGTSHIGRVGLGFEF
jgi:trimeric autotransporter adhesin